MTVIYSNFRVDGLEGRYINPSFFSRVAKDATKVYTDNAEIEKAYKALDIEVLPITEDVDTKDVVLAFIAENTDKEIDLSDFDFDSVKLNKDGSLSKKSSQKIIELIEEL